MKNDSIWAMVLGVCKNLNVPPDYVLHEMTYQNVMLYSHATPSYKSEKKEKGREWDESLDANNPANNNTEDGKVTSLH